MDHPVFLVHWSAPASPPTLGHATRVPQPGGHHPLGPDAHGPLKAAGVALPPLLSELTWTMRRRPEESLMKTVADRNHGRRWDQPPAPRTTGGVERAVFELLRLAIGSGSRNVSSGDRWHPRRSVDMLFQLGGERVVVEYDAAYFHPSHGDDFDRSRQAFEVLGAYVIRIRERPLETRRRVRRPSGSTWPTSPSLMG